jgi:hypothetical protein
MPKGVTDKVIGSINLVNARTSRLPAHIRSPGNWLACFTQAAS